MHYTPGSRDRITASFDGACKMAFIQGEARAIEITLRDYFFDPVDLSGVKDVQVAMPGNRDTIVRRRSDGIVLDATQTSLAGAATLWSAEAHGFVTGELAGVTPTEGSVLPSGLSATGYRVVAPDQNSIGLTTVEGADIIITTPGVGGFSLKQTVGVEVSNAQGGRLRVAMTARISQAIAAGLGQNVEIGYTTPTGVRRIIKAEGLLDVRSSLIL